MAATLVSGKTGADVVTFKNHRWWAERGRLHFENVDTGEYGSITVRQCLERLKGINDMVGNSKAGKGFHMPDEVDAHQRYVDDMIKLCAKAKSQGMLDDPNAVKQLTRERRRVVVTPGFNNTF